MIGYLGPDLVGQEKVPALRVLRMPPLPLQGNIIVMIKQATRKNNLTKRLAKLWRKTMQMWAVQRANYLSGNLTKIISVEEYNGNRDVIAEHPNNIGR